MFIIFSKILSKTILILKNIKLSNKNIILINKSKEIKKNKTNKHQLIIKKVEERPRTVLFYDENK